MKSILRQLQQKTEYGKKVLIALVLFVIIIGSSWAIFRQGFFRIHDYVHGARIAEMSRALESGHIPPRWSENFGFGYGMPLYSFYAPLPYFFGAILFITGFSLITSIKLLYIVCGILTALGGYRLGSALFGRSAGLVSAALLTLAPYRAVNLFVRGALSETIALMTLPWILWSALLVFRGQKHSWFWLCVSLAALLLSHNLTAVMFLPFFVVFVLAAFIYTYLGNSTAQQRKTTFKNLMKLVEASILGFGISAFYSIPAYFEKNYTQLENLILGDYFDFHLHFLYVRQFFNSAWKFGGSVWGPDDDISFFLGWGQWVGLVLVALAALQFLSRMRRDRLSVEKRKSTVIYGLIIAVLFVISLIFTLSHSLPIWEAIPILEFVQFPWRFLAVSVVFLSILIPAGTNLLPHTWQRWVAAFAIIACSLLNSQYFRPEKYLDDPSSLYFSDANRIRREMSSILPDFMSLEANIDELAKEPATSPIYDCSGFDCESNTVLLIDRPQEKLFSSDFSEPTEVTFATTSFPGWQVEIDGQKTPYHADELGLIQVLVPAGQQQLGLRFANTPVRTTANSISVFSLFILVVAVFPRKTEDRQNGADA